MTLPGFARVGARTFGAKFGLRLALVSALGALSPSLQAELAFDVASIKPTHAPQAGGGGGGIAVARSAASPAEARTGRIHYEFATLFLLIQRAWGLPANQIEGPDWMRDSLFEVSAKFPTDSSPNQLSEMLRSLLVERFDMKTHFVQRNLPVYFLRIAEGGLKVEPFEGPILHMSSGGGAVRHVSGQIVMPNLINGISRSLDRPVVDETGLTGVYEMSLEWSDAAQTAEPTGKPTLFTALREQLGLRLVAGTHDFDVLVVDRANRAPSEN